MASTLTGRPIVIVRCRGAPFSAFQLRSSGTHARIHGVKPLAEAARTRYSGRSGRVQGGRLEAVDDHAEPVPHLDRPPGLPAQNRGRVSEREPHPLGALADVHPR